MVWIIVGGEHVEIDGKGVVHAEDEECVLLYNAQFV